MIAPTRQHGAPVAGPPATARIAPQSALIAAGRATSEALTREALDRLAVAGPRLRALSHSNADTALTDARRADAIACRLGQAALDDMPLLGLPMTVKEGLKCADAPWTMGSSVFRGRIATEDGTAVARLRAAGAVIVGQGSMVVQAQAVADYLRETRKLKVGVVDITMFRPFPGAALRAALAGCRRVAFLDRDISLGLGGVLWSEGAQFAPRDALVQNYMVGLGGGDVRPKDLAAILDDVTERAEAGAPQLVEIGS